LVEGQKPALQIGRYSMKIHLQLDLTDDRMRLMTLFMPMKLLCGNLCNNLPAILIALIAHEPDE